MIIVSVSSSVLNVGEIRRSPRGPSVVPSGLACYPWFAILNAARASNRVESRVGRGEASGVTTNGISVQPRTTASH